MSDSWREYWEGTRLRDNDNIGRLSTQSTMLGVAYGASRRVSVFATLPYVQTAANADVSVGYQWRSTVRLDRPAYYTNDQLVLSDEVAMPDVRDAMIAVGYQDRRWCIPFVLVQQRTLGSSDIRRQDMPFVSNRMDFTRAQVHVMYTMSRLPLILNSGAMTTLSGRNVGKSTMFSGGVTYVLGR